MNQTTIELSYLAASVLFILGLKGLTRPRTAVRGNLLAALGMLVAIIFTLGGANILPWNMIGIGLAVGTVAGIASAHMTKMTAMPELVAILNGLGGGASTLVGAAALISMPPTDHLTPTDVAILSATVAAGLIGAFTFWGSLVAYAKLQEMMSDFVAQIPGLQVLNAILTLGMIGLGVATVMEPSETLLFWGSVAAASVLGILVTAKVGAADMPVVIALLNSCSGVAAAATGFVLPNTLLVVAGTLVGASGLILTGIMCRAMNRTLANVLFSGMGTGEGSGKTDDSIYTGKVKATSPEEVAMLLEVARRVVIVPGYGMAVAQAQHAVRDLTNLLDGKGIEVEFGIHPVAGRMPGHMNVLLAEANIPYDKLKEMDEINSSFETTDVVLVIGANDVVNPMARDEPQCPIGGMPILNVDSARTVVVIKRSLSPGFAKIPNPLFAADNTLMLFGDGRKVILELISALKDV